MANQIVARSLRVRPRQVRHKCRSSHRRPVTQTTFEGNTRAKSSAVNPEKRHSNVFETRRSTRALVEKKHDTAFIPILTTLKERTEPVGDPDRLCGFSFGRQPITGWTEECRQRHYPGCLQSPDRSACCRSSRLWHHPALQRCRYRLN